MPATCPLRIEFVATTTSLLDTTAHSHPATRSVSRLTPLALWHLLSVDAPTVAALWTWFIARVSHTHLPVASTFAMAVAVWMLYAADRLLDTRDARFQNELEDRHYFHRAYQHAFSVGIVVAALVLAALLPQLPAASIRLYLILGAFLFAYFVLIHSAAVPRRLPKELAVGIFFSAAIFIPTVSRQPELRMNLLPAAILFAALCSLNCLFIYKWEHPLPSPSTHPATSAALGSLSRIGTICAVAGLILAAADRHLPWQVPAACALSAVLLLVLTRSRDRFTSLTLRAAADLCLLTPLLFWLR